MQRGWVDCWLVFQLVTYYVLGNREMKDERSPQRATKAKKHQPLNRDHMFVRPRGSYSCLGVFDKWSRWPLVGKPWRFSHGRLGLMNICVL